MNWGYKILFAYLLFVAGILFLVFKASQVRFDLVEQDYYEAELKYQDRIDAAGRTAALSQQPIIKVQDGSIKVQFPPELAKQQLTGEALLYYPADANKDWRKRFQLQGNELLQLQAPGSHKGLHKLKLNWEANGQSYYFEEAIYL
ncbi:MAG: FixH family protein [Lacibacter sp.]